MSNLKKDYFWNTIGSGLNAFNSLFFLVIATRINGTKDAGIFTFCFATACLLYIGAIYSGRAYQITDVDKKISDYDYILHRLITTFIAFVCVLVFGLFNHYPGKKLTILLLLCLFKAIEAICDVFHGILQKNNNLYIVGISLLMRSILNLLSFLVVNCLTKNLVWACIALVITNAITLIFIDIRYSVKCKVQKSVSKESIMKIFKLGFYTFGTALLSNYLMNIPRYALDYTLDDRFQTVFGIIVMPATMIYLMNQFVLQPLIIRLKNYYYNDLSQFIKVVLQTVSVIVAFGFFGIICAYFIGIPFLNLIYGIKLDAYLYDLLIILFGAIFYAIANILSNALIVARETKIQFIICIVVAIISAAFSYLLVKLFSFRGASISYLVTMLLLSLLYIISFVVIVKGARKRTAINKIN